MANHVATVHLHIPPHIPIPTYKINISGEDWAHTNNKTGEVTIQPGQINAVTCTDIGETQEYRHLIKGPDKPKCTRAVTN